jgi:prenyltransferase beta subunit
MRQQANSQENEETMIGKTKQTQLFSTIRPDSAKIARGFQSCRDRRTSAKHFLVGFLAFWAVWFATSGSANAQIKYTPQHEKVQTMIKNGLAYLESTHLNSSDFGYQTMYAMAAYKSNILFEVDDYKKHVLIDRFLELSDSLSQRALDESASFNTTYAAALACILYMELDADAYRGKIEMLLAFIFSRQQEQGAWGYRDESSVGDISQMQYIALALWLARQKGFEVDPQVCKRALDWIIQYQEAGGGWCYKYPRSNFPSGLSTSAWSEVRHSLVAAGLGSVYLYADNLQLFERQNVRTAAANASMNLPRAVVDVTNEAEEDRASGNRRARAAYDVAKLRASMSSGNSWFNQNFDVKVPHYNLYYLYGFERYIALRQYLDGPLTGNSGVATWYDQGVDFLEELQRPDGRFRTEDVEINDQVNTAFAILFLTQSMSITLGDKARSLQKGYEGFAEASNKPLVERDGRVVETSIEQSLTEFLELMQNSDANELAMFSDSLTDDSMNMDGASRGEILQRLRSLVNHENPLARLRAVKFLASGRRLDNVPALIFALSDPNVDVVVAAHEGMKFLSRKTDVADLPWDIQFSHKVDAIKQWRDWYLRLVPDGQLMEFPEEYEKALNPVK